MNNIIETQNLTKVYPSAGEDTYALKNVNFAVSKGESLAIIGKSGSGKSTLMHVVATLDRPTSGQLLIDGQNVTTFSSSDLDKLRNKKFGFVFQQFFLNGRNTCLDNAMLPLVIMGVGAKERKARALAMLQAVGLGERAKQKAADLSGGQKQRLCIARALITNPEVIFADEPTGNLDTENGKNIIELLFKLQREQGITLIIVTHDPDLAKLCQRTIVLKDGEIIGGAA
jgi:putative ABC transport system ATP-binding protein